MVKAGVLGPQSREQDTTEQTNSKRSQGTDLQHPLSCLNLPVQWSVKVACDFKQTPTYRAIIKLLSANYQSGVLC